LHKLIERWSIVVLKFDIGVELYTKLLCPHVRGFHLVDVFTHLAFKQCLWGICESRR